jgi:dipeptidyl aminopeptidase/acylaminoacyl peptidase
MTRPITIEDVWKLKRPGQISLSPDGAEAVVSVTAYDMEANKSNAKLWLLSTLGGSPRQLTQCGERDGEPAWSPDGKTIAFVAKRTDMEAGEKDDAAQIYLIDPDGGEARRLTQLATGVSGIKWFPDSRKLAFISWVWPDVKGEKKQAKRLARFKDSKVSAHVVEHSAYRFWDHWLSDGRVPHVFSVDVASGKCTDLFAGTHYELWRADTSKDMYALSPDGKEIAFGFDSAKDKRFSDSEHLVTLDLESGKFKALTVRQRLSCFMPSYSPDGRWIACLAQDLPRSPVAPQEIALIDRESGGFSLLSAQWDRSANGPLKWREDSGAIYCLAEDQARMHLFEFPLGAEQPAVAIRGGTVVDFDIIGGTAVGVTSHLKTAAQVVACEVGGGQTRIENFNDAVMAEVRLGDVEEVTFPGWHGEPAHMWVFYPPGFDPARQWPLVHVIHGGPHTAAADGINYRWNPHVFAAMGYVVAQVNYHGSSSFGREFQESIYGAWGTKEHADIEAATDFMLARGFIDPERLAATGGSYGGYLVAWMNGRNGGHGAGDRYKAYVCHAGILDWVSKFADESWYMRARQLGAWYWEDPAKIDAQNPRLMVKHMATPTLVIHGALDYRVPDAQGLMYFNTLKMKGVAARLVHFPDENHWVLKPQNSRLWYREYAAWLKRFIGAGPTQPKPRKKRRTK